MIHWPLEDTVRLFLHTCRILLKNTSSDKIKRAPFAKKDGLLDNAQCSVCVVETFLDCPKNVLEQLNQFSPFIMVATHQASP